MQDVWNNFSKILPREPCHITREDAFKNPTFPKLVE